MKLYPISRYVLISASENTAELYEYLSNEPFDLKFVFATDITTHTVGYKGIISKYGKSYYVINENEIIENLNENVESLEMF